MAAEEAPHLLVVDDDERLRGLLRRYLADNGFRITLAADAAEARLKLKSIDYDLAIVDVMMPGENGFELTQSLKAERRVPILMLTAMAEAENRIHGLEQGADDYLAKPFYTEELLARVRALLRRAAGFATADIEIGPLRIDTRASRVTLDGNPVKLTSLEYRLLAYLAHHKGRVVSRTELVEHLYDQDFDRDSNTIEVFVGRLRRKLDANLIQTVRGLGYCLEDPNTKDRAEV